MTFHVVSLYHSKNLKLQITGTEIKVIRLWQHFHLIQIENTVIPMQPKCDAMKNKSSKV